MLPAGAIIVAIAGLMLANEAGVTVLLAVAMGLATAAAVFSATAQVIYVGQPTLVVRRDLDPKDLDRISKRLTKKFAYAEDSGAFLLAAVGFLVAAAVF